MPLEPTDRSPETSVQRIFPDLRAFAILTVVMLPLFGIWTVAWLRRGALVTPVFPLIALLALIGWIQLMNKTLTLDDSEIVQGWPPFRIRIGYGEIGGIHNVHISSRYGSVVCLAVTANAKRTEIRLPMKSFALEKRKRLVAILKQRAPQARIDPSVAL